MSHPVTYSEIHAYMLKKTSEYCAHPPAPLVDAVIEEQKKAGRTVSRQEAEKLVSPIQIQRLIKQEMAEKWPEFMASIPSNPLRSDNI